MSTPKMVDVFTDAEIDTALATNPAGYAIAAMADEDPRILTMSADLGATLADFREKYPDRYLEFGIAETNSISVAAGLATCGYVPYIYSMSPFGVLKCAEQLRTDVAYTHLPVRLVGRLTGLAMGYFGTSHHAVEDIAVARAITGMTVVTPADSGAVLSLMRSTRDVAGPVYLRIAEGAEPVYETPPDIEFGRWPHLRDGNDVTLIAHGLGTGLAVRAAARLESQGIEADVYDAAYLKPFDEEAIVESLTRTGRVLTVEDHSEVGGLGALVAEVSGRRKLGADLSRLALPDVDLEVGVPAELYEYYGLTADNVVRRTLALIDGD
ncbi:transketolase family protein [Amycolatopsis alkalitolerans]|uniref:Transketolase n=1 Tax=Amycolatopsis alkalitolerans TaxID=2547244 RepID=A0A5C4M5R8_9PSEU|nr:transketolase C-terminal domain-containing protein [Amycolatopsis alkalitolerans]TNC26872.1 transketolase [Amycolatopsis alkalitolerans]